MEAASGKMIDELRNAGAILPDGETRWVELTKRSLHKPDNCKDIENHVLRAMQSLRANDSTPTSSFLPDYLHGIYFLIG